MYGEGRHKVILSENIVPPPGTECCLRKQVSGLLESRGTPGKIPT